MSGRRVALALVVTLGAPAPALGATGSAESTPVSARFHAAHLDPVESESPLDLRSARLTQSIWRLELKLRTAGTWGPGELRPWRARQRLRSHLCLTLHQRGRRRLLCVVSGIEGGPTLARRLGSGRWTRLRSARSKRPSTKALVTTFRWAGLGFDAVHLRWRVNSAWLQGPCAQPSPCRDRLPARFDARLRLRWPKAIGCRVPGPDLRRHGPRGRRKVAITFDDGPGPYTKAIARELERHGARATFFQLGSLVGGGSEGIERRLLREGHELANHTMNHETLPGYATIAETSRRIRRMSGFKPCLFRPPGGALSGSVIANAQRAGMKTITWDVDPRDWAGASAASIQGTVLGNARPGSIVVMHDGGGPRANTLAALPGILRGLRRRHLRAVTVTKLLGGHVRWR